MRDDTLEALAVRRIERAEAQIDNLHLLLNRPFDSADDRFDVGRQRLIEDLHRIERRIRRFLADRSRHRRAVAKIVEIDFALALSAHVNAAGYAANVRMRGIDAAINDRHAHAAPGEISKRSSCEGKHRKGSALPLISLRYEVRGH